MVQFSKATITNKNGVYVLEVEYTYWGIWNYTETHILKTLEEAKSKLLQIRTKDHLIIINEDGNERNLDILK